MTTGYNKVRLIDGRPGHTKQATLPTSVDKPAGIIAPLLLLLLARWSMDDRLTLSHAVYSCAKLSSDDSVTATIVYLVGLPGRPASAAAATVALHVRTRRRVIVTES